MTHNPNSNSNPNQPDPSGFNHPEGYSAYNPAEPAYGDYSTSEYGAQEYGQQEYGQQEYGAPAYGAAYGQPAYVDQSPAGNNGMAMAAMIVGIIALVFVLLFFPIAFVLGIVAIVLAVIGIRRADKINAQAGVGNGRKGMAISGLVMGILSLLASVALMIFGFTIAQKVMDSGVVEACEQYQNDPTKLQNCVEEELKNNPDFFGGSSDKN